MKTSNRDLLVLTKSAATSKVQMDAEVKKLHELLHYSESMDNFCIVNEIIDIDNYKVIGKPEKIRMLISKTLKPFQFINNKN